MDKLADILLLIAGIWLLVFGVSGLLEDHYKEGQVDALTGNARYHLVTNELNEVSWEETK